MSEVWDFDLGGEPLTPDERAEYDFSPEAAEALRRQLKESDYAQGSARNALEQGLFRGEGE